MTSTYDVEMTDTFGGEANYSWVRRATITEPDLTHYGYDGSNGYSKARRIANRELMRKAKAAMGLTNVRGVTHDMGDSLEFWPYGMYRVMFITFKDD